VNLRWKFILFLSFLLLIVLGLPGLYLANRVTDMVRQEADARRDLTARIITDQAAQVRLEEVTAELFRSYHVVSVLFTDPQKNALWGKRLPDKRPFKTVTREVRLGRTLQGIVTVDFARSDADRTADTLWYVLIGLGALTICLVSIGLSIGFDRLVLCPGRCRSRRDCAEAWEDMTGGVTIVTMKNRRRLNLVRGSFFVAVYAFLAGVVTIAAQPGDVRVAVLVPGNSFSQVVEGFREGLGRFGYQEGKNLTVIVEETKGAGRDVLNQAARLVAAKPDVLFSIGTSHTVAANRVTSSVPIVFAWVGEPVRDGLITRYTSSNGNVTGVASSSALLSGKRLEILKEIAPGVRGVLTIVAVSDPIAESSFLFLAEKAKHLDVKLVRQDVATKEEAARVIAGVRRGSVDAVYHIPSAIVDVHLDLLIRRAREEKIPLIVHEESMVEKGALVSYGIDFKRVGAQAAKLAAKILKGAKPSEIPVEIPQELVLTVNITAAREIGLTIPRVVLERADRRVQ
jgi:putative ABC transport system substrate-binding protein